MYKAQGIKLREFREKSRCTLNNVAKKTNITTNYLSLIERGQRKPSEIVMYSLAKFYQVNPLEIFSLYGIIPTKELEKIVSSPSLIKILSSISADDSFTDEEKELISKTLQEEVENLLQKKR